MSKAKPELKLVEDTGSQLDAEDLSAELPPQQSEMPFAVVEGEPVTQLPRDLYIPPDALQVFLTAFEGPLDLLLYLIRKQNLDILNIPIAEITRQYMQYIDVMAEMQLELAGEYLLMAAMLAEIKSRMLLPRPPVAEGQEEEDPRAELVRRLQEYERFKKAAEDLDRLNRLERDNITASAELEERKVVKLLPDVTLKEMLDAFRDVLSRAEKFAHHHISRERLSQRERMSEILVRLQTVAFFEFRQLFKPEEGRMGVTVTFIAILELMKEGLIEIVQAEAYAPIHVRTAQRHLKVVQGGQAASESADAENAAALAQPELVGENDIPDEDETPPADDAAVAVQEAVADVAAASSIAVDNIEADTAIADAGFVEAAVSEAVASTESAAETVAEVAVTDEAAAAEVVAEEVAAGLPVVVDEAAVSSLVAEEVTLEDVPHELGPVDEAGAFVDPLAAPESLETIESIENESVETSESVEVIESVETNAAVEQIAAADRSESHPVEEHVVEEHEVEEHIVPEHVVEEHVVPEPEVEKNDSQADAHEVADRAVVQSAESVVEFETAEANEFVTQAESEDTAAESTAQVQTTEPDVADEFVADAESAASAEEIVASVEQPEVVEEFVAAAETADIADETVGSSDLPAMHDVTEHAQPTETTDVVIEDAPALEAIEVVAEDVPASESIEVVAEAGPAVEAIEVAAEDVPAEQTIEVAADTTSEEPIEVAAEDVPADEMTNVVAEDAPAGDAAEQDEPATEQTANLSEEDDRVTEAGSSVDNSDAEPSR
nr:segregation/condensation protein A [Steroidobacter cummioxidans]